MRGEPCCGHGPRSKQASWTRAGLGGSRTVCVAGRRAAGLSWPTLPRMLEAIPQETTWSAPRPPEAWPCAPALPLPPKLVGGTQLPGSPRPPPPAYSGSKGNGVNGGSSVSAGSAGPESLFSYGPLGCLRFSPFLGTWCATCLPKKKGGRRKNPRQTSYNPKRVFQVSTLAFSPKRGELMTAAPQTLLPASSPGATQSARDRGGLLRTLQLESGPSPAARRGWISSRSAF